MVAKGGGEMNNFPEVVAYMIYGAILLGVVLLMMRDGGSKDSDYSPYNRHKWND